MFKKTEESEWTRFSRALGGKDQPRERDEVAEPGQETVDDDTARAASVGSGESASAAAPVEPPSSTTPAWSTASDADDGLVSQPAPPAEARPDDPWTAPPASAPAPTGSSDMMPHEEGESIVGEGTTVDGTFRSDQSIRIRGAVQGEVESKRNVLVEDEAKVNAKITAQYIAVAGQVNGELTCPGKVEITPSGRVTGEINAGTLIMQEGAYFEGHLKMLNRGGPREGDVAPVGHGSDV